MDARYKKIRNICEGLNYESGKTSQEYLFTICAVDLFYYNNNIGQIDIKSGFVDGKGDGGIDFIFSDFDTMKLVQGKSSSNISIEDVKNVFYKMIETITNFDEKNYNMYSKPLINTYLNAYDDLNDNKNLELVLFTQTTFDEKMKKQIEDFTKSDQVNGYDIFVYDKNDFELRDAILEQGDLVSEDFLLLSETSNSLKYGENGLIVNISALSLKHLYEKHGQNGLFSYNLREHISQKSVDEGIEKTIKEDKDNFWFYNNGITIGCKDFSVDGYKMKIFNFSIINGAQTTTNIGKSKLIDEKYDFALPCKIVKANINISTDSAFIAKISETSNSQKPIKARDLKSNAPEQKMLQNNARKNTYPLSIEIKRGVKPVYNRSVEKWQRVTNEYVGQLIYACILQKPGPARNAKTMMFASNKAYKQVFLRKHDYNTLYDLVRLGDIYTDYCNKFTEENSDIDLIAIAKNGKLTVLSILLYLYKKEKKLLNDSNSDQLHKDNIIGLLITDYKNDDLEEKLYNLFDYIIKTLNRIYEMKKESLKLTSYSNFFKSETIYDDIILREFDSLDNWDQGKISEFLKVFDNKKIEITI